MIFDTHSHYDDSAFDADRDELLSSLKEKNVEKVIACGAAWNSFDKIKEICSKYDFCYPALGIHPEEAYGLPMDWKTLFDKYIEEIHPVAIGEIGLDYHENEVTKEEQRELFIYQLSVAEKFDLPVIIHSRDAALETMEILKTHLPNKRGVIHCFSSSYEMAAEYVKMGFYIGIGGVVTFKNGLRLKEVAEKIPLSSILIETDCPYMAPVPFRGKRNDSSLLSYVVDEIASLRQISTEEVVCVTTENACKLFNIPKE